MLSYVLSDALEAFLRLPPRLEQLTVQLPVKRNLCFGYSFLAPAWQLPKILVCVK